ncbi:MAG: diaminopimelate decarboxylase [Candidatus Saccharibacteria bacterium]
MKVLPFDAGTITELGATYPTPYHIYDEAGLRATAQNLNRVFNWAPGFTNYYAVKALPNPAILALLKAEGMGADCSSLAELVLAEKVGFQGHQIMFSSNDTPAAEFVKANELGAIINLDDISHIDHLIAAIGHLPDILCFRFNPGSERTGNVIIGNPAEAKYGLTRDQIFEAYRMSYDKGVRRFGLHTMLASNELDPSYFIETARMMFELARELKDNLAIELEFINLGGGFGIPYLPDQAELDVDKVSSHIKTLYETMFQGQLSPKLYLECGRYVTGPHGYLVSTVLHLKHTYRDYVGLDASMANLMRPALYGAYHHITVLAKQNEPLTHVYDVTGLLCENNDKFAIQRMLPKTVEGDIVVIHDTGAHGHSMGFNYNGTLRSAELLWQPSGETKLIRRAETLDDYFSTLTFD